MLLFIVSLAIASFPMSVLVAEVALDAVVGCRVSLTLLTASIALRFRVGVVVIVEHRLTPLRWPSEFFPAWPASQLLTSLDRLQETCQ